MTKTIKTNDFRFVEIPSLSINGTILTTTLINKLQQKVNIVNSYDETDIFYSSWVDIPVEKDET